MRAPSPFALVDLGCVGPGFVIVGGLVALAAACAEPAPVPTVASDCKPVQQRPDGECCPVGRYYAVSSDECLAVGPAECADVAIDDPMACVPRWCWDWRNVTGHSCEARSDGCHPEGRRCSDDEIDAGAGCAAGSWPAPGAAAACVPAGLLSQAQAATSESAEGVLLPALEAPPGVPALAPLPEPTSTWLCLPGEEGRQLVCSEGLQACKDCVRVGVPWLCPKGFVVQAGADAPGLAPCLPDPADCGDGPYPTWPAGPSPIHVHAVAAAGGDGSKGSPLRTLAEALAVAKAGDRISLASGAYAGGVKVTVPVHIRGRCAAKVTIEGPVEGAVIHVVGPTVPDARRPGQSQRVRVDNVTLVGGRPGFQVIGPLPATLERAHVRAARQASVMVKGDKAEVEVRRVVVADSVADMNGAGFGIALATPGASASIVECRVSRARVGGVAAAQKGHLEVDGLLVDGTLELAASGAHGAGLVVQGGSDGKLANVRLSGNKATGMLVAGAGSVAQATGLLVDGTLPQEAGYVGGHGVQVSEGASLTLRMSRLTGNRTGAVLVTGASTLDASGLLGDGTLPRGADGVLGVGIQVNEGSSAVLRSVRLSSNHAAGLHAAGKGSSVDARWLLVDGTRSQVSDGDVGYGVQAAEGALITLVASRLSANHLAGLEVTQKGSRVRARELLIDGTKANPNTGLWGNGVLLEQGATAELRHCRISQNLEVGVALNQGSRLQAVGVLVDSTREDLSPLPEGDGVQAHHGAALSMVGSRIAGNRLAGVIVGSAGTSAAFHGTVIEDTRGAGLSLVHGVGFYALAGVQAVQLVSSLVRANRVAGVAIDGAGIAMQGCVVLDTRAGEHTFPSHPGRPDGKTVKLADGIAAVKASSLLVEDTIIWQQARAGVLLLDSANVTFRRVVVGSGFYGLVVQGNTTLEKSALLLHHNSNNLASNKGLPIPPAPLISDESTGD